MWVIARKQEGKDVLYWSQEKGWTSDSSPAKKFAYAEKSKIHLPKNEFNLQWVRLPLSEEQKKEYLKAGGLVCPFCGRTDAVTDYGLPVIKSGAVTLACVCLDCECKWEDNYTLTGISDIRGC